MDADEDPDVGRPILAAAGFQPASRLKGGYSQDWLPHCVFQGVRATIWDYRPPLGRAVAFTNSRWLRR